MRDILVTPFVVVGCIAVLPLLLIALLGIGMVMLIAEKQGAMKLGGIHRDTQDIGIWD